MACICGLLLIISRMISGLLIRLCIIGEFMICLAASGSRISAWAWACIEAAEKEDEEKGSPAAAPKGDRPGNMNPGCCCPGAPPLVPEGAGAEVGAAAGAARNRYIYTYM
jgi:hypothetical protein